MAGISEYSVFVQEELERIYLPNLRQESFLRTFRYKGDLDLFLNFPVFYKDFLKMSYDLLVLTN